MMKKFVLLVVCIATAMFAACQPQTQPAPDTKTVDKAAEETALKNADADWSKAAAAQDVDKTVSYYAADALVLPPNGTAITDRVAIRNAWKEMITAPGFSGGWTATKVEVAKSGEIGYVSGTWEFKSNGPDGKATSDHGKFVEVWKKQSNGPWKCAVDIWNSDVPLPTPEKK